MHYFNAVIARKYNVEAPQDLRFTFRTPIRHRYAPNLWHGDATILQTLP